MELEHESLGEIGNVILHSFIGSIANFLKWNMSVSLPKVIRGDAPTLFAVSECLPTASFRFCKDQLTDDAASHSLGLVVDLSRSIIASRSFHRIRTCWAPTFLGLTIRSGCRTSSRNARGRGYSPGQTRTEAETGMKSA